jgi:hypothetical protein
VKIDNNLILRLLSSLRQNEHQSIAQILKIQDRLEIETLEDELISSNVFKVNPNWKGGNSTVDGFKWLIPTESGRRIESGHTTFEDIIESNKKDNKLNSKTINQNFNFNGDNYGNVSQSSLDNSEMRPLTEIKNNITPPIPFDKVKISKLQIIYWVFGIIVSALIIYKFIKEMRWI